jgi:hypothetical protein
MVRDMTTRTTGEGRSADELGLEPVAVLPVQFFAGEAARVLSQPERRLMLAVLEEAVSTFQRNAAVSIRAGRRELANVEAWFASDDTEWPYAFVNICHTLGLDVSALRSGLRRWKDRRRMQGTAVVYRAPFRRVCGDRHRAVG